MPRSGSSFAFLILIAFPVLVLFVSCQGKKEQAAATPEPVLAEEKSGEYLFQYYMCMTCHSFEGKAAYGPGLDSLYMSGVRVLQGGKYQELTADREYLKRSILDPDHERLEGYENKVMPKPDMSPEDAEILVDYIISKNPPREP